jgi:predicted O-linked N-acetylglucosamine transferase (SPINDLY family)
MTPQQALQLAITEYQSGRLDSAARACREALATWPGNVDLQHMLAVVLHRQGDCTAAIDLLKQAIAAAPSNPQLYNSLGNILKASGEWEEAVQAYERALHLHPDFAEAIGNLGTLLHELRRYDEASALFRRAVALRPQSADFWTKLGTALLPPGHVAEAIDCFNAAIDRHRGHAPAHSGLGVALIVLGEARGMLALREALGLKADLRETHDALLLDLHYHVEDPQMIFDEHQTWSRAFAPVVAPKPWSGRSRSPDRRLRVGYVSPDFRQHPVSLFMEPILESHDHEQFEIFCYADAQTSDGTTERLRSHTDFWRDTTRLKDDDLASRIEEDEIDLLIDLAGHTGFNRLPVFARKPAPVQVTYLGYVDTTGLSAMDYRITDSLADPPGESDRFSVEELIRLDACFLTYREPAEVGAVQLPPSHRNGYITFGSFNNFAKVSDATLSMWTQILKNVPASRLHLKSRGLGDSPTVDQIRLRLERFGFPPDRVDLQGPVPSAGAHLNLYHDIDIALDTYPYSGTRTTCDALWMGVPVVTRHGQTHASRVGLSILSCVGLQELTAHDAAGYVRIATSLAGDRDRLAALRFTMRDRLRSSPLMDSSSFSRRLESAYRDMWRRFAERNA